MSDRQHLIVNAAEAAWNPFASIVVILCVPIIFWIGVIEVAGVAIGFGVEPWMRSGVIALTIIIVLPLWTGLWLKRT